MRGHAAGPVGGATVVTWARAATWGGAAAWARAAPWPGVATSANLARWAAVASCAYALAGAPLPLAAQDAVPAALGREARAREAGGTFEDETAARLYEAALRNREHRDESVLAYTAVVRQRVGVALRTPLKDRTLYRVESAHRLFWSRDGDMLVQALALREQTPAGESEIDDADDFFDQRFDPMNDRLFFGLVEEDEDLGEPGDDDFWFEHPLYREYAAGYRFSTGDTLTLSLPDGRSVRAVELRVVPHVADVHRMTGSLWIEPQTGALVRAAYRLADTFDAFRDIPDLTEEEGDMRWVPGLFKPWTVELSLLVVEYALWDFEVWLPRAMRVEGVAAAGILKAPMTFEISYRVESVRTRADAEAERAVQAAEAHEVPGGGAAGAAGDAPVTKTRAPLDRAARGAPDAYGVVRVADDGMREIRFRTRAEAYAYLSELTFGEEVPYAIDPTTYDRNGRRVRYLLPEDPGFLARSPELPPPIWEDAPGFVSEADVEELRDGLASLPLPPLAQTPYTFRWGTQRPDLVRYNRVEALSIGARLQLRPPTALGPLSVTATGRLGVADLEPNARVDVVRETLERRIQLSGYTELAAVDEDARHLGIGNSILALTVGRDDGDYYRRAGAALEWKPPTAARQSFRVRAYSEYHRAADVETDFALFHIGADDWAFRDNIVAQEGWEHGLRIDLTPWWGTDPNLAQGGFEVALQAGTGDWRYARGSLVGRLALPLPAELRLAMEAGAGTSLGDTPAQRLWYVGGPRTLRGYAPRSRTGETFGRARAELARTFSFGSLAIFSDFGWAGPASDFLELDDGLHSVGTGLSILDGLIRFDAAWGLREPRDFRIDLYLDAVL